MVTKTTKIKGRSCLLGDNIRDEESQWAVFSDLGSSPPTLEACRSLDALSCMDGYVVKTSDARGAYCQTYLTNEDGIFTWVSLPEHRQPVHWKGKYDNPVVLLVLALYGHPQSGGFMGR